MSINAAAAETEACIRTALAAVREASVLAPQPMSGDLINIENQLIQVLREVRSNAG